MAYRPLTEADLTERDQAIFAAWQAATKKDDILLRLTVRECQRLIDILAVKLGHLSLRHLPPKLEDPYAQKKLRKAYPRKRKITASALVKQDA